MRYEAFLISGSFDSLRKQRATICRVRGAHGLLAKNCSCWPKIWTSADENEPEPMSFSKRAFVNTVGQKSCTTYQHKKATEASHNPTYQHYHHPQDLHLLLNNMRTSALIFAAALATASAQDAYNHQLRGDRFLSVSTKAEKSMSVAKAAKSSTKSSKT
jgi:hypothetical protein